MLLVLAAHATRTRRAAEPAGYTGMMTNDDDAGTANSRSFPSLVPVRKVPLGERVMRILPYVLGAAGGALVAAALARASDSEDQQSQPAATPRRIPDRSVESWNHGGAREIYKIARRMAGNDEAKFREIRDDMLKRNGFEIPRRSRPRDV